MKILFSCLFILLITLTQVFAKEPYQVYLMPKSVLIDLEDKSEIVTVKGRYVLALEENPNNRHNFWIYNKDKKKVYITSAKNIFIHEPELRLLPSEQEKENKVYWDKRIRQEDDTKASFETNFALHFETLSMTELNGIYQNQNGSTGATRYEVRTFYMTEQPWQFGLNLNFQSIYWDNGDEKEKLAILSLGPSFSYTFYNYDSYIFSLLVAAEIAPIAKASSTLYTEKFGAHAYDLGLEAEIPSEYGRFTLGTHFRQQFLTLRETTRTELGELQSENKISSLGFSLGYKIDWDL